MGNLETRAEQYYQQKKTAFNRITNEWTSLSREFPEKLKSLIISGFTSSVSSSRDEGGPYSVRVGVSISANTDSAKEYAGRVQKQIERIKQDFETNVQDMDKTMDGYKQEGLDSDLLAKLISLLKQWVDYIATMKMDVSSHVITVETDPKLVAIRKKWDDYGNVAMRQAEAKRFGVELADLDKHKRYLEGKQKKATARTSAVMEQAYRILSGVGSYLDADKLAKEAKETAAELKSKEEEAARRERERREEEARKRAEEEHRRREMEQKEEKEYEDAMESFKAKTKEVRDQQNKFIREKEEAYRREMINDAEKSCNANLDAINNQLAESEKQIRDVTARLAGLGLFAFAEKKKCRELLSQCEGHIANLRQQKSETEKRISRAKEKAEEEIRRKRSSYEEEAATKYPLPQEPAKPGHILLKEEQERKEKEARERAEKERLRQEQERKQKVKDINADFEERILNVLRRESSPMTVSEIMSRDETLSALSNLKVSSILNGMVGTSVQKILEMRKAKFTIL